jgi:hypothetical protein
MRSRRHVVSATIVVVSLLVAAPRAPGDDNPQGGSVSAERLETEGTSKPGYDYPLAEAHRQDQAAKTKQESLSIGPIAIHLDGIFCHAASVVTLLSRMMQ